MKKIIYLIVLILVSQVNLFAQKETNIWHFGHYSGLDFNNLSSVVGTNPFGTTLNVPNMPTAIVGSLTTNEGCFTVSSYNGNFLFSSDGTNAYTTNAAGAFTQMPNGNNLGGDPSATQSGIVIPRPGHPTQYYVVAVGAGTAPGGVMVFGEIKYSIVDTALNGGKGDVVVTGGVKTYLIATGAYENIAAVPNGNEIDYWLINRTGDTFYVYAVTEAGISSTPTHTLSHAGITTYGGPGVGAAQSYVGEIALSRDYSRIASVNWTGKQVITADFNNVTGQMSNIIIGTSSMNSYSICFSPNSEYLFVGTGYDVVASDARPRLLYQSWTNIRSGTGLTYLAKGVSNIKLHSDGRLYGIQALTQNASTGTTRHLYVMLNPDTPAEANLVAFPNYLVNPAYLGLPSFPAGFIRLKPVASPFACTTHSSSYFIEIDLSGGNSPTRLVWDFGDGTPLVNENISDNVEKRVQSHIYGTPGDYTITVNAYKGNDLAKIITMDAHVTDCILKTNKMTRSELLNSREMKLYQ